MTNLLETAALRLEFDPIAGGLTAITNKLTGETYAVSGDAFAVETTAFRRSQAEMRQIEWALTEDGVTASYADADLTVAVAYELRSGDHFFQKRMAVTFAAADGVTQITLSQPTFTLTGLDIVCCRQLIGNLIWRRGFGRNMESLGSLGGEGFIRSRCLRRNARQCMKSQPGCR